MLYRYGPKDARYTVLNVSRPRIIATLVLVEMEIVIELR